jgi:hypothetical protein
MTTQETHVEEPSALEYEHEDWRAEEDELPPRPRRKLLSPIPVTLMALLLVALAFFAGVQVEKGQSSSAGGGGLPSGLAALKARFAGAAGGAGSLAAAAGAGAAGGGLPGAGSSGASGGGLAGSSGAFGALTRGEVSYVSGNTLYVLTGEGNTVKVSAPAGTTVKKTVSTNVHSIHPGDTVVVQGSQAGGSVKASSITVGSGGSSSSAGSSTGSSSAGGSQQLFGSG